MIFYESMLKWTGGDLNLSSSGDFTRITPFSLKSAKNSLGDEYMLKEKTVTCPECGSQRSFKDGIRYTCTGEIQRYICRDCAYRYSERPAKYS
jgi:transposase-like protein